MTAKTQAPDPVYWTRSMSPTRDHDDPYYGVMRLAAGADSMAALRKMFPDGKADDLNFCLFSTSGVHGSYCTIEAAEAEPALGVTFLIVQPRIVGLRYGNCEPRTPEDFAFLKALRQSSRESVATIGGAAIPAPEGAPSGNEREAFLREFTGGSPEYRAWVWQGWQARAALAAPAPQAPVALPDVDLCRLISSHEVYQYHPGALNEFSHAVIAEFCRVNGITAPQTKEPTNDR